MTAESEKPNPTNVGGQALIEGVLMRAPGSLGNSSFAAKVMKGMRMGGQMGNVQVKVRRLKVLKVFP